MRTVYATPKRGPATQNAAVPGPSALPPSRLPSPSAPLGDLSPAYGAATPPATWPDTEKASIPQGLLPPAMTDRLLSALHTARCRGHLGLVEEIRLRAGRAATLTVGGYNCPTDLRLSGDTLADILVHLSGGSLYAYSDTIHQGYLTLPGGIRVGVAGRAVCEEGRIIGVTDITSLCIRLPHPHMAVGGTVCRLLSRLAAAGNAQGVLIYAPPGVGKTTLLRAVAAGMASGPDPWRTVVVDTRGELGFDGDRPDLCLDILKGYPRARGVEIATRTLSAELIVCDEIGDVEEAMALISTHHGGVPLVASAHAGSVEELLRRTGIRLLHEARLFGAYVGIRRREDDGRTMTVPGTADRCSPGSEIRENRVFHRERHRGSTVDLPCATVGPKPDFYDENAVVIPNGTNPGNRSTVSPTGGACGICDAADTRSPAGATTDYLYRITPWADADRLTGGT